MRSSCPFPPNFFEGRHWLLGWGLPISLGIIVAIVLGWFKQ